MESTENTWNRLQIRREIWHLLKSGQNLAMFAPRRLGKTYLLQELLQPEAQDQGWQAVYCDLQGEDSCEGAVLEIIRCAQTLNSLDGKLLQRVRSKFQDIMDGEVSSFQDLLAKTDWIRVLNTVLEDLNNSDVPTVMLIDEVTICVAHIMEKDQADGRKFMNTMRKVRNEYKNIRWLLTGSIGLDHLVSQYQMEGSINNLEPVAIEPFSSEISEDFANFLCQSEQVTRPFVLEDEAHKLLQLRLGWLSPFYIERLCRLIQPSSIKKDNADDAMPNAMATSEDIDRACGRLLQHPHNQAFKDWLSHIDRNISADLRPACRVILGYLCESKDGESRDNIRHHLGKESSSEQIKRALNILLSDGYLKLNSGNRYQFAMPLLADYWARFEL